MDLVTVQVVGVLIVGIALGLEHRRSRRCQQFIRAWAEENNYRLIEVRNMFPFAGPFLWTRSGPQAVFRVSIYEGTGVIRSAWLLCGNWWGRITSNDIRVHWDA